MEKQKDEDNAGHSLLHKTLTLFCFPVTLFFRLMDRHMMQADLASENRLTW